MKPFAHLVLPMALLVMAGLCTPVFLGKSYSLRPIEVLDMDSIFVRNQMLLSAYRICSGS